MTFLKQTLRALVQDRLFSGAAVISLALGIGASTAIFTVVNTLLLQPLPYRDADRIVVVRETIAELRDQYPVLPASAAHFLRWRERCRSCEELTAISPMNWTFTGSGEPVQVPGARVSANFFRFLGTRPALGRDFSDEEDAPGRERVVVLSHAFWRAGFGGDLSIQGRSIVLNGQPHEVVGVLPAGFRLPQGEQLSSLVRLPERIDIFRPMAFSDDERQSAGDFSYAALARLGPGVTLAAATTEVNTLQTEIGRSSPFKLTLSASLRPMRDQIVGDTRQPLLVLLAATVLVLLIVCVNVANLVLARHARRRREAALRLALGAGRGRLVREALWESALVALAGGSAGVLIAWTAVKALIRLAPPDLPRIGDIAMDGRVLAFALAASAVSALVFAGVPALRLAATDPADTLRGGGNASTEEPRGVRLRSILVSAQVALCTLLLVAGGLVLKSYGRLAGVDKGFVADHVLTMEVSLPSSHAAEAARAPALDRLLRHVQAVPGIRAAALVNALPLTGESNVKLVTMENDPRPELQRPVANYRYVSADYFSALSIPIIAGRTFQDMDRSRHVVVLSARTARVLWPDQDPVGKRMHPGDSDRELAEVVGVAADTRVVDLRNDHELMVYEPFWDRGESTVAVVIRTSLDPSGIAGAVRERIRASIPDAPVSRVRTLDAVVSESLAARRFQTTLLTIFGLTSFAIAALGVYGVVAYLVARRTRELSIRLALGAQPRDVYALVLHSGLVPVVSGLAVGLAASVALGRLLGSLLFGVRPGDPATLGAVTAALVCAALAACLVPARRAAGIDPVRTLRQS